MEWVEGKAGLFALKNQAQQSVAKGLENLQARSRLKTKRGGMTQTESHAT